MWLPFSTHARSVHRKCDATQCRLGSFTQHLTCHVLHHVTDVLIFYSGDPRNGDAMHSLNLMMKLLFLLQDPAVTHRKVTVICTIITYLLQGHFSTSDIHRHGKTFDVLILFICLYKINYLALLYLDLSHLCNICDL